MQTEMCTTLHTDCRPSRQSAGEGVGEQQRGHIPEPSRQPGVTVLHCANEQSSDSPVDTANVAQACPRAHGDQ